MTVLYNFNLLFCWLKILLNNYSKKLPIITKFFFNFEECRTKGGPVPNVPCVFPFNYEGTKYTECTTIENSNVPSCSTEVDTNGIHVESKYGSCSRGCPGGPGTYTQNILWIETIISALLRLYLALFEYAKFKLSDHGVLHVESKNGRYQIPFNQAAARCVERGMVLATKGQLTIAYNQGFELCRCGWVTDQNAYYPMQTTEKGCGKRGINSCGNTQNYDVYCYEDLETGKF